MSTSRRGHTQGYLRRLLSEHRLRPRPSLGQCFLIDLNLLDILLEAAQLCGDELVLEVGSGTGSLTRRLTEQAGAVLSVEIDSGFYRLAQQNLRDCKNVVLLHADILKNKNALNPQVLASLGELACSYELPRRKLAANLPYCVATPVISLLLLEEHPWDRFVVTIQKELADRMIAAPGTKDYGGLSVVAQSLAKVELVRTLPRSVFWPRPKVSSAIVSIRPDAEKRAAIFCVGSFVRFVRGVMSHRRKNLRRALSAAMPGVAMSQIDQCLERLALDPQTRAEALGPEQFIELAEACQTGL